MASFNAGWSSTVCTFFRGTINKYLCVKFYGKWISLGIVFFFLIFFINNTYFNLYNHFYIFHLANWLINCSCWNNHFYIFHLTNWLISCSCWNNCIIIYMKYFFLNIIFFNEIINKSLNTTRRHFWRIDSRSRNKHERNTICKHVGRDLFMKL